MEKLDQELQRRVWQRVREGTSPPVSPSAPPRDDLRGWMLEAQENAAVYHRLSRQMTGRSGELLRRMEQESLHSVERLKGLVRLQGENCKPLPRQPETDSPRRALERCYHRERRMWEQMGSSAGEAAPVLELMRRSAGEHCGALAEILGRMV